MKNIKIYLLVLCCFVGVVQSYTYGVVRRSSFSRLEEAIKYNRLLSLGDLRVSTPWELPLTLNPVENIFSNPLGNMMVVIDKVNHLTSSLSSSAIFALCCKEWLPVNIDTSAANLLSLSTYYSYRELSGKVKIDASVVSSVEIRSELERTIADFYLAILEAKDYLMKAVNSIPEGRRKIAKALVYEKVGCGVKIDRDFVLEALEGIISEEEKKPVGELPYSELEARFFRTLEKFDLQDLVYAGYLLVLACERNIPKLFELKDKIVLKERRYLVDGRVLISGRQDDKYFPKDIENVELLIDLGGNNTYLCNAGFAEENQIRIVIDLGENIVIKSRGPAGGSGIYGIGLVYLPNSAGRKAVASRSFSVGCGIFGIGAMFISGEGEFSSRVFSQGAGTFGIGIVHHTEATNSTYVADFFSQGAGMCKGVGLLYVEGDNIVMNGGFSIPDPREPNIGTTSMCQGVGYGVRAVTGGGVGLAVMKTSSSTFRSSYFAQGSGYWHSLGVFYLVGNNNRLQARRYSQGAGIHTGCGMMMLFGDNNYTTNWGVGPAYGWDGGVGIFISSGCDNMHRAEWGCGHGEINGRAISIINGERLKLSLPNYGSGSFSRNTASYSLSLIEGNNISIYVPRLQKNIVSHEYGELKLKPDPWGILAIAGRDIIFSSSVVVEEILPPLVSDKKEEVSDEGEEEIFPLVIVSSVSSVFDSKKVLLREIEKYLKDASGFHTETTIIRSGVKKLLSLDKEKIDVLLTLLTPYKTEEVIVLLTVLASYGKKILPYLEKHLSCASGMRKVLITNLLSYVSVEVSVPILFSLLEDSDWRVRSAAVRTLGYLFNHDRGINYNHGRRTILEKCLQFLSECNDVKKINKLRDKYKNLLNEKVLSDVYGILNLWSDFGSQIDFYEKTGSLYDWISEEAKSYFFEFLVSNKKAYEKAIREELARIKRLEKEVQKKLIKMIKDEKETLAVVAQAITALGELNLPDRIVLSELARFLELSFSSCTAMTQQNNKSITSGAFREAVVSSLGRFGKYSSPYLKRCFFSGNELLSAAAITAVAHTWDKTLLQLLKLPFEECGFLNRAYYEGEKRELLQLTALATLANLRPPLSDEKEKLCHYFNNILKKTSTYRKKKGFPQCSPFLSESVKTAIQLFLHPSK